MKTILQSFVFIVFTILIFLLTNVIFVIKAQVGEVSKTSPTDEEYYELTDVQIIINNQNINNNQSNSLEEIDLDTSNQSFSNSFNKNNPSTLIEFIEKQVQGVFEQKVFVQDIPTTISIILGSAFIPMLLTLLALILSPNGFLLLIGALSKSKDKVFGIIYDIKTEKPISFVRVKLYYKDTNKFIQEKLSDLQGRYGFTVPTGRYRIEIHHPPYQKYIKTFDISEKEAFFAEDIGLSENTLDKQNLFRRIQNTKAKIFNSFNNNLSKIILLGLLFSIIAFILRQTMLEFSLIGFYSFIIIIYYLIILNSNKKRNYWGEVIDVENNLKISGAIVRLYSTTKSLVDTQMTDNTGRFGFLVDPGEYLLYAYYRGYELLVNNQISYVEYDNNKFLKLKINKLQWLKLNLYMKPIYYSNKQENKTNSVYDENVTKNKYKFGTI